MRLQKISRGSRHCSSANELGGSFMRAAFLIPAAKREVGAKWRERKSIPPVIFIPLLFHPCAGLGQALENRVALQRITNLVHGEDVCVIIILAQAPRLEVIGAGSKRFHSHAIGHDSAEGS